MPIWFRDYELEEVRKLGRETMVDHLGIEITYIDDQAIHGSMPVDARTKQPAGLLHGGASVALAESLASIGANLVVDPSRQYCVGLEINANHVGACTEGKVQATAAPLHLGKSTQVWETRIHQGDRLVCVSRMTLAVLERRVK
ncbi:MAG: hotdog fold thioesterase [Bacteriovoracia bacterium]